MLQEHELIERDIDAYLAQNQRKELLRVLTAGSVDDGKSTLIGRLLHDSKLVYEDTMAAIRRDSVKRGSVGGELDLSLLTDGLKAEREQGITIDVAYRFFSTAKRKFIIADCPGHEQYTRNMATGASTADLAIILVDARHGVLTQTKRHSFIVSLLGIKHVVVTINKMDLVDFNQERYEEICQDYRDFSARLDLPDLHFIPISALQGDNVVDPSTNMPWYKGSTLMNLLETVYIGSDRNLEDFRFPVQLVNRPHLNFRGFCGTVSSGIIRQGDEVMVLPSRRTSRVKAIVTADGDLPEAFAPQSVTLTLEDEVDCSRGDMIVRPGNVPKSASDFDVMLVWMSSEPMIPGKTYIFKQTTRTTQGQFDTLRYRIDVNTLHRSNAAELQLNEIARCRVALNQPLFYDAYRRNRVTGAFIVIDRITNVTVGAGMILDRDTANRNRVDDWDETDTGSGDEDKLRQQVSSDERRARFGQSPATVLLTGLSGSGKTSLAFAVERALFDAGRAVTVLDGDQIRRGINRDLGYSIEDRSENLRRSGHIAKLLNENGLITIAAFVAPSESVRQKVAELVGRERFLVVHCNASLEACRQRDQRGHYAQADRGELPSFPGVTAPYEPPVNPDLVLDTENVSLAENTAKVVELLRARKFIR